MTIVNKLLLPWFFLLQAAAAAYGPYQPAPALPAQQPAWGQPWSGAPAGLHGAAAAGWPGGSSGSGSGSGGPLAPGGLEDALDALARLAAGAERPPRGWEVASLVTAREEAFAAAQRRGQQLPLAACCQLLQASAAFGLAPTHQEHGVLERAAAGQLSAAHLPDLQQIVEAYQALDMQPGSAMAAALQQAADRLLPTASPQAVTKFVAAWCGRRWRLSPAMLAAAERVVAGAAGRAAAGVGCWRCLP